MLPTVPYQLAQYWDRGLRERVEERKAAFANYRKKQQLAAVHHPSFSTTAPAISADVGPVPKDLRATAKRTPAVKSWVRVLEEPVRQFLVDKGLVAPAEPATDSSEEEDDEVVFVGRNGSMMDSRAFKRAQWVVKEKPAEAGMVLDTLGDDETSAFKLVSPLSGPKL